MGELDLSQSADKRLENAQSIRFDFMLALLGCSGLAIVRTKSVGPFDNLSLASFRAKFLPPRSPAPAVPASSQSRKPPVRCIHCKAFPPAAASCRFGR